MEDAKREKRTTWTKRKKKIACLESANHTRSSLQSSSSSLHDQSGEIIKDFPENALGQINSNSFIDNAQHDMPLLVAASSINDLVSPVKKGHFFDHSTPHPQSTNLLLVNRDLEAQIRKLEADLARKCQGLCEIQAKFLASESSIDKMKKELTVKDQLIDILNNKILKLEEMLNLDHKKAKIYMKEPENRTLTIVDPISKHWCMFYSTIEPSKSYSILTHSRDKNR